MDDELVRRVGFLSGRLLSLFTLIDELLDLVSTDESSTTELLDIVEKGVKAIEDELLGQPAT